MVELLKLAQLSSAISIMGDSDNSDDNSSDSFISFKDILAEATKQMDNDASRKLSGIAATSSAPVTGSGAGLAVQSAAVAGNTAFDDIINRAALKYGIDFNLIKKVISAESSFRPDVVSNAGAQGLMQLMPSTGKSYGVTNPFDPEQNIDAGVHYLSDMLKRFKGDVTLALAAYNAGPGAVKKYNGIPPYEETINYIKKILDGAASFDKTV